MAARALDVEVTMRTRIFIPVTVWLVLLLGWNGQAKAQATATGVVSASGGMGAAPKVKGMPMYKAPGFRLGDAALHPALDLSFGYDSNVFYSSDNPYGSVLLTINPKLAIAQSDLKPGSAPRKVLYAAYLGFDYKRYFQELGSRTQRDFFGANVAGTLDVFPASIVGFDLHETFVRTSEPRYIVSNKNFDRDMNVAGLGLNIRPGGGMLQIRLGYRFVVDLFEAGDLKGANYYYHQAELYAKWKFFPLTSWWLGATWQFTHYMDAYDNGYKNADSKPIRVMMGVSGRFLPRLVVTAGVGYAYSWYDNAQKQYNLPIGMVDVAVDIGPFAKISFGYEHNFQDVMWADYYTVDTAYITYNHLIANVVQLGATFRWLLAGFEGIPAPPAGITYPNSRTDNAIMLGLRARYLVTDWFSAALAYQLRANFTDFATSQGGVSFPSDYVKHVALLTATFSY